MDKRKRFNLNLEIFKDIFKVCLRVQGQDFDALPIDEEIMSFLRELRHMEEINSLNDVVFDHMHLTWRNFATLINKILSGKTTGLDKLRLSKAQILWHVTRGKGNELLSQVDLTEDAQFEEVRRKGMRDLHKTHPSGFGTVTKTNPSAAKIKPSGNDEDDRNNEQDSNGEVSDQENNNDDDKTQSDNENESDFEHETDESKSTLESDHEENVKAEGDEDEDEEIDYTTSQLDDDVDIRLNELVDTNNGGRLAKIEEPVKGPKAKESQSGSSKGNKYQSKSFGKSVQLEEPEFEVTHSDMPQDQEEKPGNDDEEPKGKVTSKCNWFTKPKRPQEPTDPDWNDRKTPEQGPAQSWSMTLASSDDKLSKNFDELMSTPIDFSTYIMNNLNIANLTQETLLGPTLRIIKVTRVETIRKHGYGYLRKIEVQRPDNNLYTFKEGDFPRLHINDIEDMLILIVQNRLTNLSSDDVSDFTIAL
nr:hypothetical protein CTI12_AA475510 [Tanacetum cinerariifolium]